VSTPYLEIKWGGEEGFDDRLADYVNCSFTFELTRSDNRMAVRVAECSERRIATSRHAMRRRLHARNYRATLIEQESESESFERYQRSYSAGVVKK